MNMSLNDKFHSVDIKKDNNIVKLVNELCAMTECDQDQAYMQLSSCDFDFEAAALKILESSSINRQADCEWQLINRQKKFKKKQDKIEVGPSGDGFKKMESNRHTKYKGPNTNINPKTDHFQNEDKINNNRAYRNKKNRFTARKPKEIIEVHNPASANNTTESFIISDSEIELRWDNVADIDGAFKESSNNSQADGFLSEDDFGLVSQLDDHSYHGPSTQLVSEIQQNYKTKGDLPNNSTIIEHSSYSQTESQLINEYLCNQLPIFGNYSQTPHPPSISKVPNQPVSFFRAIKPIKVSLRRHYNFGINVKDELHATNANESKYKNSTNENAQITNSVDKSKIFQDRHPIIPPNDTTVNQALFNNELFHNQIINTIINQQKVVAMMLGNHQPQSYYDGHKQINMISMPNSNHVDQVYMNMHPAVFHGNMENGITIQSQDGFVPTFITSNSMSVPFHRK